MIAELFQEDEYIASVAF